MRRFSSFIIILVLIFSIGLISGCKKEPTGPPPECAVDDDCGVNKHCSGGKCLVKRQSPKQKAEGYIKHANKLLAESKVNYGAVISAYENALNAVPTIEGLKFNIGLCFMKMGDFPRAAAIFEKSRQEDPEDLNSILALGRLYILQNKLDAAQKLYSDYAAKHPRDLEVATNMATIYRLQKKYDKAMVVIRSIFVIDPAHPGAFNNLGLLYMAKGELLMARMVTVNGIEAQKNVKKIENAGLYNNLGLIYLKLEDIDRAVANFRIATKIDPKLVSSNLNLGHIALKYNDYASAKTYYNSVLSEDPNQQEALLGLAQCLGFMKQEKKAVAIYKMVLKKNPKEPTALYNAGILYFEFLKLQKEAHDAFRRFLATGYKDKRKVDSAKIYLQMDVMIEQQPYAEPEPEQVAPAAAKPAEAAPVETAPVEIAPAEAAPVKAEPAKTETPADAKPEAKPEQATPEAKPEAAKPKAS